MTTSNDDAHRHVAIRHLRQLIDALNRRVPHIERAGEAAIARDAAELMKQALKRLKALEKKDPLELPRGDRSPKRQSRFPPARRARRGS